LKELRIKKLHERASFPLVIIITLLPLLPPATTPLTPLIKPKAATLACEEGKFMISTWEKA
jgi:hypothetical protein